jgi:diguanylate cyclase (GGDEF)-like protein
MSKKETHGLYVERVKSLYQRSMAVIPLNIVTSTILAAVLYGKVDSFRLFGWVLMIYILTFMRAAYAFWVIKRGDWENLTENFHTMYILGSLFAGILWIVMFFMFAFEVPESYLLFIIFVIGGMVIGAASSMATSPPAYFCYITPMIVPPAVIFLFEADLFGFAMSILLFITFFVLVASFLQNYRVYMQSLRLKIEKDHLIHNLQHSNKELEDAYGKIIELSNTDELTGIANRRSFDINFKKEWGRALRSNLPLSFIMVDIDYFKAYNDTFGHQQGDRCLQMVVSAISDLVKRPGDSIARYGGEEFCVILPDTDLDGAKTLAEGMRHKVEDLKIPAADKTVSDYVTISLGVSSILPDGKIVAEDLIYAADKALYLAKQHGRNRIEIWEADT